ncbi:MAG: acyltransferase family protein, partial [Acidimicrobiales bacterium]
MSNPGLGEWTAAPRHGEPGRPAAGPARPARQLALVRSTRAPAADPNHFMPGIEALRGIAVIAVLICHLWALTTAPLIPGWQVVVGVGQWAVDVFFLLSGFLLVSYFWTDGPRRPSLRNFYVRRIFRIVPAYYLSLAVLFWFMADRAALFSDRGLRQVIANVTFTQWLFPTTSTSLNVNGVYWTLSLEMALYALLPLFAYAIAKRPVLAGAGLIGVCVAYRLYIALDAQPLQRLAFSAQQG